jgi:probable HAF family extracellular repeat protein
LAFPDCAANFERNCNESQRQTEDVMNVRIARFVVFMCAVAALVIPLGIHGQSAKGKHHHYELIDLGTFGGPESFLDPDNGLDIGPSSPLINNGGTVTGWADTTAPDPLAPDCFEDCFVSHVFRWENGVATDLGALPGGGSSASTWIAPNGLIAGMSETGELDPLFPALPVLHAVLWKNGTMTDLGTLPEGGNQSVANAVNSRGQVIGVALNTVPDANSMALSTYWLGFAPYGYQTRAFIWENGKMQDLGTLGTGTNAQAVSINESGQVIGWSYISSNPSPFCADGFLTTDSFIWDKEGGMKDLGTLGGTCTLADGMNNKGQVVGTSNLTGDIMQHAFIWQNGSMQDLGGSLGGDYTGAFGVTDTGEAFGYAYLPGDATYHAAIWRNIGDMTDLGVLGNDTCSIASSVNGRIQVVGTSAPRCNFDNGRAFLWEDGSIVNLLTLVLDHAGLRLQSASNITYLGEIVGTALDTSHNQHAVLLIPCDANHPNIEGCNYSPVNATAEAEAADPATDSTSPAAAASASRLSPFALMAGMRSSFSGHRHPTRTAALTPNSMDFSCVARLVGGGCTPPQNATLTNTGTVTLSAIEISISGTYFAQTNSCPSSLARGESCTITLSFDGPASRSHPQPRTFTGSLSVSDGATNSPQEVSLTGKTSGVP